MNKTKLAIEVTPIQQYSRATKGSTVRLSNSEATISPNLAACCGVQGKDASGTDSSSDVSSWKSLRCSTEPVLSTRRRLEAD